MDLVFVGGSHGRCGTGILKRILCTHSQISSVTSGETQIMEIVADVLPYLRAEENFYSPRRSSAGYAKFESAVRNKFGCGARVEESLDALRSKISGSAVSIPRFGELALVDAISDCELFSYFGRFLHDLFSAAVREPQSRYACEKTPSNAQYIEQAFSLAPGGRMIVMIRHPVDTALSFLPPDWGPNDPLEAAKFCHAYLMRWRTVSGRVPRHFYREVKLENLICDPAVFLSGLFEFLELNEEECVLDVAKDRLREGTDRKSCVSNEVLEEMQSIMADDIEQLGYKDYEIE